MGFLSDLFNFARPFIAPTIETFQRQDFSQGLEDVANRLLNLPNEAGLNNSWEQIRPILSQYTAPIDARFNEVYDYQRNFADQTNASLSDWLATGEEANRRLLDISSNIQPPSLRELGPAPAPLDIEGLLAAATAASGDAPEAPDIESYLPQDITSLEDIPGFVQARDQASRATSRAMASQGYGQSGNALNAIADNISQLGLQAYSDEANRRNAFFGTRSTADLNRFNTASQNWATANEINQNAVRSTIDAYNANTNAFSADVDAYNAELGAYETNIDVALAPLRELITSVSNNVSSLSGTAGNANTALGTSMGNYAEYGTSLTNNIMDYLAQAQSDRAGLYGDVAGGVGELLAQSEGFDSFALDPFGRALGGSNGGSGGVGGIIDAVGSLLSSGGSSLLGGGGFTSLMNKLFGGGATTSPMTSVSGSSIGEVLSGTNEGLFSNLFGGGQGGASGAMSGFNNWFAGPGGTMAGFALPAGLFARASMAQSAERGASRRVADNWQSQIDRAAAQGRDTVSVTHKGKTYELRVGPQGAIRNGDRFQLADGRWIVINSDADTSLTIADGPGDAPSSQATRPNYLTTSGRDSQGTRVANWNTGADFTPWQLGLIGARPEDEQRDGGR